MHQLPAASWILILCSTVPWLIATAIYYLKNRTDGAAADERADGG